MKIKSIIIGMLLGLCLIGSSEAVAKKMIHCSEVLPLIEERGVLVVGMLKKDFPPFFMQDENGKLIGSDVTLATTLADALHVTVRFDRQYDSFDQIVDAVAKNKVDVGISSLSVSLIRESLVNFSRPYALSTHNLVFNYEKWKELSQEANWLKVLDSPKTVIAAVSRSTNVLLLKDVLPQAKMVAYDDLEQATKAVLEGKALITTMNDIEYAEYFARKGDLTKNFEKVPLDTMDKLAIAVPKESCDLLEYIDHFFLVRYYNGLPW